MEILAKENEDQNGETEQDEGKEEQDKEEEYKATEQAMSPPPELLRKTRSMMTRSMIEERAAPQDAVIRESQNDSSLCECEMSAMSSLDEQPHWLSQSPSVVAQTQYEKSIKNINHSFNNITSFMRNSDGPLDEKVSSQLANTLDEMKAQCELSAQHCNQVICRGDAAIYEQSLGIVSSHLTTLSACNDITTADFEQLQQSVSKLIHGAPSTGQGSINIQRLICSLL